MLSEDAKFLIRDACAEAERDGGFFTASINRGMTPRQIILECYRGHDVRKMNQRQINALESLFANLDEAATYLAALLGLM